MYMYIYYTYMYVTAMKKSLGVQKRSIWPRLKGGKGGEK